MKIKSFILKISLIIFFSFSIIIFQNNVFAKKAEIIYPLKQISKLNCRFIEFSKLWDECKKEIPILKTKNYTKYIKQNWWYNEYTRLYTVLWWASYKYGWDVWNGWHIWVDIATAKWTPVYAIADWEVIKAQTDSILWTYISIKHKINWKIIISNYAHLSDSNVIIWNNIIVWQKIWEVWSTWNSTWNHLHFQIDLDTSFHPFYYNYKKCPFSYYRISEEWLCINELSNNTLDPLLFLETSWAILNQISIKVVESKNTENINDLSIFDKIVYYWYNKSDIKKVQEVFKNLWLYTWVISWLYKDIEKFILAFQISKWIIKNENSRWAWWFWPKTSYYAKKSYLSYLDNKVQFSKITKTKIKTKKISRKNILTRAQIEKREIDSFLRRYKIKLKFNTPWSNIKLNTSETIELQILNKIWKPFLGNTPWKISFIIDEKIVNIFPKRIFNFADWKRNIKIFWKKEGVTKLYIKIWKVTIKTIDINIYSPNRKIYLQGWKIYWKNKVILWEENKGVVLFKDKNNSSLIKIPFEWIYKIKASGNNLICIKKWNYEYIKKIYKTKKCTRSEYKNELLFKYEDTVWWLLIYNQKILNKNSSIKITNNYNSKNISELKMFVYNPKWLDKNYIYIDEIIDLLWKWVLNWINKWYFLQDRVLTKKHILDWIENMLFLMKKSKNALDKQLEIERRLIVLWVERKYKDRNHILSRKDLLNIVYWFLIFDNNEKDWYNNYIDILKDKETSFKIKSIFDKNITWKDRFGKKYFRPTKETTRWEWAFLLYEILKNFNK